MYRDDHAALRAEIDATRRQLRDEHRRRVEAEREAQHARTIAAYINPRPRFEHVKPLVIPFIIGGLTVASFYLLFRAARSEGELADLETRHDGLVASAERCERDNFKLTKLCSAKRPAKRYATVGPSWLHEGMSAIDDKLQACRARSPAGGTVYLKGAVTKGRITHGAVVGPWPATPLATCVLQALENVHFENAPGPGPIPFHYTFFLR